MPTTIQVNGTSLTLVHKFSNGISTATVPDVCKTPTPGGPVPMPYPNIAQSITLSNGTTTVKGDKAMAANKGSKFAMSNGDQAGTVGGVKSNVFMKEATWILYSPDTKLESKNACRLTDPMYHNAENTVNMAGEVQGVATAAFAAAMGDKDVADKLCDAACGAMKDKAGGASGKTQDLMNQRLSSSSFPTHGGAFTTYLPQHPNILSEVPALTPLQFGDSMLPLVSTTGRTLAGGAGALAPMSPGVAAFGGIAREAAELGGKVTIWDAVILKNPAAGVSPDNISRFVEVKFPGDTLTRNQRMAQLSMNEEDYAKRVEMRPQRDCQCT
jgi:hypothetical protein